MPLRLRHTRAVDDYASMIGKLEAKMTRGEIAAAIGVEKREIDEIASGYVPDEEIGERLRELAASGGKRIMRVPVWAIVLFVAVDALIFAAVLAAVFLF